MATKRKTSAPKKSAIKKTTVKKTTKKVAKRRTISTNEKQQSRWGKTRSAFLLGIHRANDRRLYEFTNKNKKALKELPKNDAIRLMKSHCDCPEDMRQVKSTMITKTELHKIINER